MKKKSRALTEAERTGLAILLGNQQDVLRLMEQLTYSKARVKDVAAGFAWLRTTHPDL